jgi:hypothetical protein
MSDRNLNFDKIKHHSMIKFKTIYDMLVTLTDQSSSIFIIKLS